MKKIIKVVIENLEDAEFIFRDIMTLRDYIHDDIELAIDVMKDDGYRTDGVELKKPYVRNGKTWINIHVNDSEKTDMDILMSHVNAAVVAADRLFKPHIYIEQD